MMIAMVPRVLSVLFAGAAMLAAQAPVITSGGVLNAAAVSAGDPVAAGSLISIFGTNLAAAQQAADSIPLSTSLSDVTSVQINGTAVPLTFVSPGQINAQMPWSAAPGTATVVVNRGGASGSQTFQVAAVSPAVYFYQTGGQFYGIALNVDDYHLAWPQNLVNGLPSEPAQRGHALLIYANGLGAVDPPAPMGDKTGATLRNVTTPVTVMIGGVQAQVLFQGLSPDFVGVNQINVMIPDTAPTGDTVPIQIVQGGVTTTSRVVIAVR